MSENMISQTDALAQLATSRRSLQQTIQGLSDETLSRVAVEGSWTIKDVLGHIASWEETCVEPIRRYASGAPFEVDVIEDYHAWNDEQAVRKQQVSLEAVLDDMTAVRERLVKAVGGLSAQQWTQRVPLSWGGKGTVIQVLDVFYRHEMEHARTIQQWRETLDG